MKTRIQSNVNHYIINKIYCLLTEKGEFDGQDYHLTLSEKQIEVLQDDLYKAVMNILENKCDFMVMNEKGTRPPRYVHGNYQQALKEAERLNQKLEGKSTVLMIYDDTDTLPF